MTIQNKIDRARAAFEQISDYTQEQVDKLVYESAKIIYENAEPLAKMAVEETRLGSYEDKIGKNTGTAAAFWDYLKVSSMKILQSVSLKLLTQSVLSELSLQQLTLQLHL